MAELDLAFEAHNNMAEAFASLGRHHPKGVVHRSEEMLVSLTGSPISVFNEVMPVSRLHPVGADALAAAIADARNQGADWMLHLRAGIDDLAADVATELGLLEEDPYFYPAMVLTAMPDAQPPPSGLDIRVVHDDTTFKDYLAGAGSNPELTLTWLSRGMVDDPNVTLLSGYMGRSVAARSVAVRTDRAVGVYNVGVQADRRRRGFGWALTLAAIRSGVDAGCTVATLQSSEMGFAMYENHGFTTVFHYRCFRDWSN